MPNYLSRMKPNGANGTEYKLKDEELREAFDVFKEDIKGTQTATGNPITLTDGSETYAQGLSVELEPKQDLHGQPAPYVGGAGKNKFNPEATINSKTTVNGNEITLTATGNFDGSNPVIVPVNEGETWSISGTIPTGCGIEVFFQDSSGTTISTTVVTTPTAQFTIGTGIARMSIILGNRTAGADTFVFDKIQVEKGSTATPFATYSNICPISGYEGVEVEDVGFNQWDEDWEVGDIDNNGQPQSSSTLIRTKNFNPCKPNTTYRVIKPNASVYMKYYDEDKNFISPTVSADSTITTPTNCYYFKFVIGSAYGTTYNHDISINYPSTDHNYHPHQSRTASVTFGQTVYGGMSDFTEGGTSDNMKKISLASLSWSQSVDAKGRRYSSALSDIYNYADFQSIPHLVCDSYKVVSGYDLYTDTDLIGITTNQDKRIYIRTPDGEPPASGELCYEVATPTQLSTPPTELKLLKGTNNITTNGTTITLDYIPNNSIGDAVKASEEYTDRAVEGKADNTTAYVDLPGNYDTTNKNFPTRSATSGSVENCLTYINDLADKLYTAINSHATVLATIPTKTVVVNHRAIDVGDEFNISLPLSYKFLIVELYIYANGECGSIVSTDFANGSVLSIVANGHGSSYWCDLSRMANRITVDGNFDSTHGELTITAF